MQPFDLTAHYRIDSAEGPIALRASTTLAGPNSDRVRDRLHAALVSAGAEVLLILVKPTADEKAA